MKSQSFNKDFEYLDRITEKTCDFNKYMHWNNQILLQNIYNFSNIYLSSEVNFFLQSLKYDIIALFWCMA